jgi:chromosome segregation ATPase
MKTVESEGLRREVEDLERELSSLRTRVDQDNSSFSALEEQIAELRTKLSQTQDDVRMHEQRLAAKKAELAEAKRLERLEAYEEDLERFAEAQGRVSQAGENYVKEVDAYDGEVLRLRKLRDDMRDAFGEDERVAAVDAALQGEAGRLHPTWSSVLGATKWRVDLELGDRNGDDLAKKLQEDAKKQADEGRTSRILDYFK